MKPNFSRSFLIAFLVLTGLISASAQTTVTLPTIPCSNCNGPGAFSITAPACASGLVGAPLTMSWGAATGATSYTIMIATDAALTTDLATYTLTGTTLSVPAIALKPSVTYYWTVIANSSTGSTRASSICSFSTNTTWTGTSNTGGFPNGSTGQKLVNEGVAGGYFTCQTGDGTCASGDNMICNPTGLVVNQSNRFAPFWIIHNGYFGTTNTGGSQYGKNAVDLVGAGVGATTLGTTTGFNIITDSSLPIGDVTTLSQPLFYRNNTAAPMNFSLRFDAKGANALRVGFNYFDAFQENVAGAPRELNNSNNKSVTLNSSWTRYINTVITLPANAAISDVYFMASVASNVYISDIVLCKL